MRSLRLAVQSERFSSHYECLFWERCYDETEMALGYFVDAAIGCWRRFGLRSEFSLGRRLCLSDHRRTSTVLKLLPVERKERRDIYLPSHWRRASLLEMLPPE